MLILEHIQERRDFMSLKGIPKNTDVTSLIVELVKLLKPHTYVELGVKHGYTFNQVSPLVEQAVGVDRAGFKEIIKTSNVKLYEMTTDEFAKIWKSSIGFLFMDACHEKKQILKDFNALFPHVMPCTGIICIHDTFPIKKELAVDGYCGNAWEAAKEIRRVDYYNKFCEIVTIPGPWFGVSIIRKIEWDEHFGWGWME